MLPAQSVVSVEPLTGKNESVSSKQKHWLQQHPLLMFWKDSHTKSKYTRTQRTIIVASDIVLVELDFYGYKTMKKFIVKKYMQTQCRHTTQSQTSLKKQP